MACRVLGWPDDFLKLEDNQMKHAIKQGALSCAIGLSALLGAAVQANPPDACQKDIERLCQDVQPGEGRIAQCLKTHEEKLSPGCQELRAKARDSITSFVAACREDVAQHCSGIAAGGGRVYQCLTQHESALASACRDILQTQRAAATGPASP